MGLYDRGYYRDDAGLDLRPDWNQRSAVSILIIVNVAVFIANMLFGSPTVGFQGKVNEALMLWPQDWMEPLKWVRTFTYAFAHDASSPSHIFFNMLSLYFMGRAVEQTYGRNEFLRIYLLSAVFCGVCWLVTRFFTGGAIPVLGASGAVLCISMLFVFNYPRATVVFIVFPMPAWVLGVIFVLSNFFLQSAQGVAYDVHIFGILFAALYFFLRWNFSFLESPADAFRQLLRRLTGPRLKVHSDRNLDREEKDAAEADRLLEKIHNFGKDSLSSREKKFLERYSQSVRNRSAQNKKWSDS